MTPFGQPSVPPLPSGIDLSGKTAIVTGATAGIGLEICRQLLSHRLSTLIMAVRNVSKGETTRQALLSDPAVESAGHKATVKVMELNTGNYSNVQNFASTFMSSFQDLHLLMANAGIGTLHKELASSGHEKNIRQYTLTPLAGRISLGKDEQALKHIDSYDRIDTLGRYADSKALCVLFQLELAKQYSPDKIIINSFCPGLVDTAMTDVLPLHIRAFMKVVKALSARSPEKAGWIALNTAVLAGIETHGKLLGDMAIDTPSGFLKSDEGQRIQKMLWDETLDEMESIMAVPAWMKQ